MIRVHSSTDINYLNNMGIVVLKPNECKVKEVLNGIFTLELTHNFDLDNRWKALDGDNIIVASTPKGLQGFRILNTVKDMQNGRKIQARHVFFDLEDNMLLDVRPENKNGKEALDIILAGATNPHNFKAESDILGLNTAYFVRKNIVQALLANEDNSFLSRWGGELYRDNYTINMRRKLGMDNGFVVKYRRNLTGLTETRDDKEIVTRIIPVGFNGLMLDGNKPWVDSTLINSYANIKSRVVDFQDIKVRDEQTQEDEKVFETVAEARAEMVKRCKQLYGEGLDKPKLTYNVEFADLSKTLEYKDFSFLETVRLGDVVTVKHSKLGIDIKARVIEYEWDSIKEKYIKITLGAFQDNLLQASVSAKDKINAILDGNNKVDTTMLEGMIDLMKVDMKAMHDVAVKHKELAILFEDLEEGSTTFGAMALGTKGFMIAAKRTPDKREWDWRTFGTGQGFVADMIVAGYIDAARIKAGSIEANKLSVNAKSEIREGLVTEASFNVDMDGIRTEVSKKTDRWDVRSVIEQTPESVQIGFNGINDTFAVTAWEVYMKDLYGQKHLRFYDGKIKVMHPNGRDMGLLGRNVWNGTNIYGMSVGMDTDTSFTVGFLNGDSYISMLACCKTQITSGGITLYPGITMSGDLYLNKYNLKNVNEIHGAGTWSDGSKFTRFKGDIDARGYQVFANNVKSVLTTKDNVERKIDTTKAIIENVEFIGNSRIAENEIRIDIPYDLLGFDNYFISLSGIGGTVTLKEKTKEYFVVVGDSIEFDYLIKASNNSKRQLRTNGSMLEEFNQEVKIEHDEIEINVEESNKFQKIYYKKEGAI